MLSDKHEKPGKMFVTGSGKRVPTNIFLNLDLNALTLGDQFNVS